MAHKRLIVALDFKNFDEMSKFAEKLDPNKCIVKVGLQLFISDGLRVLDYLSDKGFDIFLDLKLHDIPNTVMKAIEQITKFNVLMTTIHLQGGLEMIKAAIEVKKQTKLIGVSLLTSLDTTDTELMYGNQLNDQFIKLLKVAEQSEIDGIVCSPKELQSITTNELIKVVPGIRNSKLADDQKRVMTAKEAYENGADYIVVGRPITLSENIENTVDEYL
ncbi:MAG: orotidine-5'-phosphate decarboxylase [Gammaproteobacteria bacterium]|nr:orotidine-5'-phosphate decarboxylase [Gammaproteobacteria bacterium]|tara:strand:+ start:985 stop:1638 length:654 start_codon:yes stop_codon:yes gene_type:complete